MDDRPQSRASKWLGSQRSLYIKTLLLVETATRRERQTLDTCCSHRRDAPHINAAHTAVALPHASQQPGSLPELPFVASAPRLPSVYDRQEPGSSLCFLPLRPSRFTYFLPQLPRHLTMLLHFPAIDPMARCIPGRYIDDHVGTCIAPLRAKYTINNV